MVQVRSGGVTALTTKYTIHVMSASISVYLCVSCVKSVENNTIGNSPLTAGRGRLVTISLSFIPLLESYCVGAYASDDAF